MRLLTTAPRTPPLNSGLRSLLLEYKLPIIRMSVALSWMSDPFECSPLACVEYARPSAMMLLLNVIRCEVFLRHSSGVLPTKRGPDAERFSSVAQLNEQWSTMTS